MASTCSQWSLNACVCGGEELRPVVDGGLSVNFSGAWGEEGLAGIGGIMVSEAEDGTSGAWHDG